MNVNYYKTMFAKFQAMRKEGRQKTLMSVWGIGALRHRMLLDIRRSRRNRIPYNSHGSMPLRPKK